MKTTREVFIIMRAGKIDKRDHEIVKKTQFCQFVNNTSYGFPTCNFILLEMLLKLTKNNSNFAKINENNTCQENYYRLEYINKV